MWSSETHWAACATSCNSSHQSSRSEEQRTDPVGPASGGFYTWLIWIAIGFVLHLGGVRLGRYECSNRTRVCTKSGPNKRPETCLKMCVSQRYPMNFGGLYLWRELGSDLKRIQMLQETVHFWNHCCRSTADYVDLQNLVCLLFLFSLFISRTCSNLKTLFLTNQRADYENNTSHMWPMSDVNTLKWHFGTFHHQLNVHAHQNLDVSRPDIRHAVHDGYAAPYVSLHNHN